MYEKINYKIVGAFVLVFISLALYFGFWLAKEGVDKSRYNYYYTLFSESVDGLNRDSTVKLNGVNIGRVKSIEIDKKYLPKVKVKIAIDKEVPITKDMYAILKSQGLTGLRYINIVGGDINSGVVTPNSKESFINTKESTLANITHTAPETLERLLSFTVKLDKLLNENNINNFSKILENSSKFTKRAVELEEKLYNILGNDSNRGGINGFIATIYDINDSITTTLSEYRELAKKGNVALGRINSRLPKLLKDLDRAFLNISYSAAFLNKTIKRGDYNLRRILSPAVVTLKELAIEYKELGDELKALSKNPAGAIFNSKSIPKGPGE